FHSSLEGTYMITIIFDHKAYYSLSFQVSVREPSKQKWKSIVFGQATNRHTNSITKLDNGDVYLVASGGHAGKITNDHDGISFYYTEIDAIKDNFTLSADIQVNEFAKDPHDGQESFGIMARDAIDKSHVSNVSSSNIV